MEFTRDAMDHLSHHIATNGLAAARGEIAVVARAARSAGAPAVIVEVLLDTMAPEVARQRAFGRAAAAIRADHARARRHAAGGSAA